MRKIVKYEMSQCNGVVNVLTDDGDSFKLDEHTLSFKELKDLHALLSSSVNAREIAAKIIESVDVAGIAELRQALALVLQDRTTTHHKSTLSASTDWPVTIPF